MIENILEQERKSSSISPDALGNFLYGEKYYRDMRHHLDSAPVLPYTPNIYNKSRLELIKDAYRYLPVIYNHNNHGMKQGIHFDNQNIYNYVGCPHNMPGSLHFMMFVKYIEIMGTEQQKKLYLNKAKNCQITGCYAQTQIGHGSDIRGLQTTATYDHTTKEWIIDSPTSSSAKYWPGEVAFISDHAMVFAQTIIKGKNYGVNTFMVQTKDKDHNWLPGIQGGDIGPKIGYHSKDNGYIYFRNIRIPKQNLFTKYVEVTDQGEFKQKGDPRVGYGAMMFVRETISNAIFKIYGQAIIIAARYSLFRKQGLNHLKQEVSILEYQTQQQKILPRIAEYCVLSVATAKLREVSRLNGQRVLKGDFSLLQENHSNLAFAKGLYSELGQDGIQILRRSMGGHGTSYYSGLPQIMNELSANNTGEGQNTVMYIQTARYIIKSYLGFLKGNSLSDSVKYIGRFKELKSVQFAGKQQWSIQQLRDAILKVLEYLLGDILSQIKGKSPQESQNDIINYKAGIRLQQLAQLHGVAFVMNEYIEALTKENSQDVRHLTLEVGKLFAIGQIQRIAEPFIEGGFVCPIRWSMLDTEKESAMKKIRPHVAVILDSFGIPDKHLRSEVATGNPYQNYLDRARECEINSVISKSALDVSRVRQVLAAKPRL